MIQTTLTITTKNCHHAELLNLLRQFTSKFDEKDYSVVSQEMPGIDQIEPINENEIKF